MADESIRILCRKLLLISKTDSGIQWLIGSPFLPTCTIVSTFRCIHTLASDPLSPDFSKEAGDLRALLPRGFEVIGALIVGTSNANVEQLAQDAIGASVRLRKTLLQSENQSLVGAVVDPSSGALRFFVSDSGVKSVDTVVYEEQPEKYVWERGCVLNCELPIKLPVIYSVEELKGAEDMLIRAIDAVVAKFRDSKTTYVLETLDNSITEAPHAVVIRSRELDLPTESNPNSLLCSHFFSEDNNHKSRSAENADEIQVTLLLATSGASPKPAAPVAEYIPGEAKLLVVDYKLKVICYATKDLRLTDAVSKLIIPGLVDQLHTMKDMTLPNLLSQHPKLHPYHFNPPGFLHPITAIYDSLYGETEMKQGTVHFCYLLLI
ncbi:hypothetical protein HanLR1_Chr05g0189601 [Helianthus annuus]|nr:hypothetical protein HanLR1_Chr05g0189601 [Helianthus annuus]